MPEPTIAKLDQELIRSYLYQAKSVQYMKLRYFLLKRYRMSQSRLDDALQVLQYYKLALVDGSKVYYVPLGADPKPPKPKPSEAPEPKSTESPSKPNNQAFTVIRVKTVLRSHCRPDDIKN
jgi:hypothetical protein